MRLISTLLAYTKNRNGSVEHEVAVSFVHLLYIVKTSLWKYILKVISKKSHPYSYSSMIIYNPYSKLKLILTLNRN